MFWSMFLHRGHQSVDVDHCKLACSDASFIPVRIIVNPRHTAITRLITGTLASFQVCYLTIVKRSCELLSGILALSQIGELMFFKVGQTLLVAGRITVRLRLQTPR